MVDVLSYSGQAEGAMPNGQRIIKVKSEDGDANPVGTRGRVLGSLYDPELGYGYFVEWETFPGLPVLVKAFKIAADVPPDAKAN